MIFPIEGGGRPRLRHISDQLSVAVETVLADQPWRSATWRRGTKGRLAARFAALRVRVADGAPQRIHDRGTQHLAWAKRCGSWETPALRANASIIFPICRLTLQLSSRSCHKSALDLRAGTPVTQGRTRPRPLRRPLLDRTASTCPYDNDRLRLLAVAPPCPRRSGIKEAPVHLLSRVCLQSGKPSSKPSDSRRSCAVRTVTGHSTPSYRHDLTK